jgi:hypothetical protein
VPRVVVMVVVAGWVIRCTSGYRRKGGVGTEPG